MIPYTIRIKHFFVLLTAVILFVGCSKSDKKADCHAGFSLYFVTSNEVEAFTPANCNKYKKAISAYIDALEKYEKCARELGDVEDWRESIREAREDIKDLECN